MVRFFLCVTVRRRPNADEPVADDTQRVISHGDIRQSSTFCAIEAHSASGGNRDAPGNGLDDPRGDVF